MPRGADRDHQLDVAPPIGRATGGTAVPAGRSTKHHADAGPATQPPTWDRCGLRTEVTLARPIRPRPQSRQRFDDVPRRRAAGP